MIKKTSMRATIQAMNPGEVITIGFGEYAHSSIRTCISLLGLEYGRKYSCHADRKLGEYQVIRIS